MGGRGQFGELLDAAAGESGQRIAELSENWDVKAPPVLDGREDGLNFRAGFLASQAQPILSSDGDWAHRVLDQLVG